MIPTILLIETILVGVAMLWYIPTLLKYYQQWDRNRSNLFFAWSMMIVGQFTILKGEGSVEEVSGIGAGEIYQLAFMAAAGLLTALMLLTNKISPTAWKATSIAFAFYVFAAFLSVGVSDFPTLSAYRVSQIAIDFLLVILGYSILKKCDDPRFLLNASLFWLVVFIFATGLGGALYPEKALVVIKGAVGVILYGTIFYSHPNSLGLLAAIAFFASVIRFTASKEYGGNKFFWLSFLLLSGTVFFLAQARTSLAACALALFLAGILLKKMRWLSYTVIGSAVFILIYYWLSGSSIGFETDVTEYVKRGSSDESIETLSGRTTLWEYGLQLFKDSPLLGHGFGLSAGTTMHSAHIGVLVNTGLFGYIPWLFFIIGVLMTAIRNLKFCTKYSAENYFSTEALLIVVILLFRSILGYAILGHTLDLMIFLSMYIYAAVTLDAHKHATGRKGTPPKTDAEDKLVKQRPRILAHKRT